MFKNTIAILVLLLPSLLSAQIENSSVNDMNNPGLVGPVENTEEIILSGQDTLRTLAVFYDKAGIKIQEKISSNFPEMGFSNDTVCWKREDQSYISYNCFSDSIRNNVMVIGSDGLIMEVNITDSLQKLSYQIEYYESNKIKFIYTALEKDKKFQFIATQSFSYHEDGRIDQQKASGWNVPQGLTTYYYNDNNLLIKTIRVDSNGEELFTITYGEHDQFGNWTSASYQNGIEVIREINYYN